MPVLSAVGAVVICDVSVHSSLRSRHERRRQLFKATKKSSAKFPTSSPRNLKQEQKADLFREKLKTDAEMPLKELEDKKEDWLRQKEMFEVKLRFEREEKEKDRAFQRDKEERNAGERKADRDLMMRMM